MGRISATSAYTSQNTNNTNAGGILDINTLTRQPQQRATSNSSAVASVVDTLERVLNMPSMQPVIQQGARVLSAFADKMIIENNEKMAKTQPKSAGGQGSSKPVFGVGSDNP